MHVPQASAGCGERPRRITLVLGVATVLSACCYLLSSQLLQPTPPGGFEELPLRTNLAPTAAPVSPEPHPEGSKTECKCPTLPKSDSGDQTAPVQAATPKRVAILAEADANASVVHITTESCDDPAWQEYRWTAQGQAFRYTVDRAALGRVLGPVAARHPQRVAIVTFSNLRYGDVLVNWLVGLNRLGLTPHVVVFALDTETQAWLRAHGCHSFLVAMPSFLGLWFVRTITFLELAHAGVSFVHSDTDAMWIRDPIGRFFAPNTSFSLKFSQGTLAPVQASSKWGFVACAGVFWAKARRPLTLRLLAAIVEHVTHNPRVPKHATDQDSVNLMLMEHKVEWRVEPKTSYHKRMFATLFTCSTREIVGTFPDTEERVAILPHHLFIRKAMLTNVNGELPYVTHYYSKTKPKSKRDQFERFGIWFLRPDWEAVPVPPAAPGEEEGQEDGGRLAAWLTAVQSPNITLEKLNRKEAEGKYEDL